jgi:hypothetical protein
MIEAMLKTWSALAPFVWRRREGGWRETEGEEKRREVRQGEGG